MSSISGELQYMQYCQLFRSASKACVLTVLSFIHQKYSWGRLVLTQELMLNILSHYSVFPSFWRILRLFGTKIAAGRSSGRFFLRRKDTGIAKCKRVVAVTADADGYGMIIPVSPIERSNYAYL